MAVFVLSTSAAGMFWDIFTIFQKLILCNKFQEYKYNATLTDRSEGERCTSDYQCANELECKNRKCKNPCDYKDCATNADCTATNHRAICSCKKGYSGHPLTECSRTQSCTYNPDCDGHLACREGQCVDPCATFDCKRSKCKVTSHVPDCI